MSRISLTVEYLFKTEEERETFFQSHVNPRLVFRPNGNIETYSVADVFGELQDLKMKTNESNDNAE